MEGWMLIWKVIFVAALAGFAVLCVWVTVWGYKDIKRLFQRLSSE